MATTRFEGFAAVPVLLEGNWSTWHGQPCFRGTLSAAEPVRVVSLVACPGGWRYAKSNRLPPAAPVDLHLHAVSGGGGCQVILRTGHTINAGGVLPQACLPDLPDRLAFETGAIIDWAEPGEAGDDAGSPIRLLVLAARDLRTRRCGRWGVKQRLLPGVPAPWRPALTRTRCGVVSP